MSRIAYVNGQYVRHDKAAVHIEDRGYQFADGVYEVLAVVDGDLIDVADHMNRLDHSLASLGIGWPVTAGVMPLLMREVVRRNCVRDGMLYLQITRGVARREHAFPIDTKPTLVMTARAVAPTKRRMLITTGVKVVTLPDIRWSRCDIKSVALLPNVLAKQKAKEAGAYEAWMIAPDGTVTEGASSNAWIVNADGTVITRPLGRDILGGVTRLQIVNLARHAQIKVIERPFTVAEAKAAREAFVTSTTAFVAPVVEIDGFVVGDGGPGPVARKLAGLYDRHAAGEHHTA
jgi:D-alanine transaminase